MGYVGKIKDSSGTTHLVASTLFGTCSTAIGTAAKVVTCSNFSQLENGVTIHVYFVNGNTAASPTLNVNSTGAIAIKRYSTTAPQCSTQNWAAGQIVSFTYYEVSSTDKRWVMNDIDQRFDLLTGTGETAQDKGAGVSPRYFPAKWKFNLNKQPQDGDIITIRIPCAGHSYGVYISLDNGTNYKPVSVNSTTKLTTHYANGKTITLVYESAGSTASIYPVNGGNATGTVSGGCWTVLNYYDYNSDTKVTQTNTTGNANYRIIFSNTADDTTRTEAARKSIKLQFNPSTCTLQLYNESTTAANAPATILFSMKDTTTGKTYSGGYIKVYQDHGATPNGDNMVINSGGGMFLGSGESPSSHYSAKGSTYTGEDCFITADGSMHLQANGNTIANRKGLQITNGFALVPEQADVATDNVGSIGTSSYRWANGYFTNINGVTVGSTPVFTDRYVNSASFAHDSTNNNVKMTLTRAGSDTSTVTANIPLVSSSTAGVAPKGATVSSQSQSTKFLREDGSWATPSYTTNTDTWRNIKVNGTEKLGPETGTEALNFKNGTNTTVAYNSGIQINLNDNVVLGSPNNEGTLTLFSGDTQGSSTGVLHQGLTSQNANHYLPLIGGDLFGSGNLVAGEGIRRSESSGIYTISTESDIVLREVNLNNNNVDDDDNYIIIDEFLNYSNKKYYMEIYYTANNGKNPGVARIPLITGVVPSGYGKVGNEFTLNITGDINTTYIRTGCFKFKTPDISNHSIRLYGQSSYVVTFANPSGTSSETKNSYTIQKKTVSNGDYTGFWVVPYKMRFIQENEQQ